MKKRSISLIVITLSIMFTLGNVFLYYNSPHHISITGNYFFNSITGTISFFVEGGAAIIYVDSPQNATYNFSVGEPYLIELNVSSEGAIDTWWYTLYDLRHDVIVYEDVVFTPNTTIVAVRWDNELRVYANSSGNLISNYNVTFFVNVPNSSPLIANLSDEILVCEGNFLSSYFNITNDDEDALTISLSPTNPFFITPLAVVAGSNRTEGEIFSGLLDKTHLGTYEETVSVNDGYNATCCVDTQQTNITVIEINNAPDVENISVQTVYLQGDESNFYYSIQVDDVESGSNESVGNYTFNISFLDGAPFLFNVSNNGIMNFSPNSSQLGVYNISVCAFDQALPSPHQNISLCGQDGSSQNECEEFSLTVTNDSRAPNITYYSPSNLVFGSVGTSTITYIVNATDPDGTIPDIYWYVDGVLSETDSGSSYNTFSHTFGCGVGGSHNIIAEATDGLLNDSVQWNISVSSVSCTSSSGGGGGGGGGGGSTCSEKWACEGWQECSSVHIDYQQGLISIDVFNQITSNCSIGGVSEADCGYQPRVCSDVNGCNTTSYMPNEVQFCHYTQYPSCDDGITNCHSGDCELLVDCGGPCESCSTCSDGILNQGEDGVDCGGPCPSSCQLEIEVPSGFSVIPIITVLIIILLIIILIKARQIYINRKSLSGNDKKEAK